MSDPRDEYVLEALLDSWDRNNAILINLLRLVPEGGLDARPAQDSPSVAQLFTHIHYVRLAFVAEDAPAFAAPVPESEWVAERDPYRLIEMLNESAKTVRAAVKGKLELGQEMDLHYDNPILMLEHLIWHESYHHGQIKLVLKLTGRPIADKQAGPGTWGLWMRKR